MLSISTEIRSMIYSMDLSRLAGSMAYGEMEIESLLRLVQNKSGKVSKLAH